MQRSARKKAVINLDDKITYKTAVPAWIKAEIEYWKKNLHIELWQLSIEMKTKKAMAAVYAEAFDESLEPLGLCYPEPPILHATIYFNRKLKAGKPGRKVVLHELLHIALLDFQSFVEDSIIDTHLVGASRKLAHEKLDSKIERLIETWTTVFDNTGALDKGHK